LEHWGPTGDSRREDCFILVEKIAHWHKSAAKVAA
jgi:hypothetical protein